MTYAHTTMAMQTAHAYIKTLKTLMKSLPYARMHEKPTHIPGGGDQFATMKDEKWKLK